MAKVCRYNVELGIPDKLFCIGDSLLIQTIGTINMIPVLVMACRMCPKNVEGTMYALLMSILNLGDMFSYQFGAILMYFVGVTEYDFTKLWLLILICNLLMLVPLPLFIFMDIETAQDIAQQDHEENNTDSIEI